MTYHVKPYPPNQAWLRDALQMAQKYKNDDVLLAPDYYEFQTPLPIHSGEVFSHVVVGGREHEGQRTILHFPDVKDSPPVTINADRDSCLHDVKVVAANVKTPKEPSDNPADYLADGISRNLIGIAIDYNAKGGSFGTKLKNVHVERAVVAYGFGCSGETLNCSGIELDNCSAAYCDVAHASGHAQQRQVIFRNFKASYCRILSTGTEYGLKQGVPPIIDGFEGSFIHTLGRYSSRFGQTLSWDHMWAEYIKGIVHWIGGGESGCIRNSTFVINMLSGTNAFYGDNNLRSEKTASVCETHSPFTFDNCNIGRNPKGTVRFTEGRTGLFRFINMPDFSKEFVLG